MNFTDEQIEQITDFGAIYDENSNKLFDVVSEKIVNVDREKSITYTEYVLKDLATKKFWKGELMASEWMGNDEYNCDVEFEEVSPKTIEDTIYE